MTKFRVVMHGIKLNNLDKNYRIVLKKIALNRIPPVLIFKRDDNNVVEFNESMYVFAEEMKQYENYSKNNLDFTKFLKKQFGNLKRTEEW